jgi:hypothetical protein
MAGQICVGFVSLKLTGIPKLRKCNVFTTILKQYISFSAAPSHIGDVKHYDIDYTITIFDRLSA